MSTFNKWQLTIRCHCIIRINSFSSTAIEEEGEWSCCFIANSGSYSFTSNGTYPMGELLRILWAHDNKHNTSYVPKSASRLPSQQPCLPSGASYIPSTFSPGMITKWQAAVRQCSKAYQKFLQVNNIPLFKTPPESLD